MSGISTTDRFAILRCRQNGPDIFFYPDERALARAAMRSLYFLGVDERAKFAAQVAQEMKDEAIKENRSEAAFKRESAKTN